MSVADPLPVIEAGTALTEASGTGPVTYRKAYNEVEHPHETQNILYRSAIDLSKVELSASEAGESLKDCLSRNGRDLASGLYKWACTLPYNLERMVKERREEIPKGFFVSDEAYRDTMAADHDTDHILSNMGLDRQTVVRAMELAGLEFAAGKAGDLTKSLVSVADKDTLKDTTFSMCFQPYFDVPKGEIGAHLTLTSHPDNHKYRYMSQGFSSKMDYDTRRDTLLSSLESKDSSLFRMITSQQVGEQWLETEKKRNEKHNAKIDAHLERYYNDNTVTLDHTSRASQMTEEQQLEQMVQAASYALSLDDKVSQDGGTASLSASDRKAYKKMDKSGFLQLARQLKSRGLMTEARSDKSELGSKDSADGTKPTTHTSTTSQKKKKRRRRRSKKSGSTDPALGHHIHRTREESGSENSKTAIDSQSSGPDDDMSLGSLYMS